LARFFYLLFIFLLVICHSYDKPPYIRNHPETIMTNIGPFIQFVIGFISAILIAAISYKLRALTISGAIGMVLIGTLVFGSGGIVFAVPLIIFFISSSFLSAIKSTSKKLALAESGKTGPRDIRQVLANGGIAALAATAYAVTQNDIWFMIYLAVVAEAAADTWATEIGTLSSRKPVSILNLRAVEPGQSGGITFLGTTASLVGSGMVILSGLAAVYLVGNIVIYDPSIWILAAFSGWAGAVFDSVLGASVQAQYKCQLCGKITEKAIHCKRATRLHRGWRFLNNDGVNFASSLFAALLLLAILQFFFIFFIYNLR